MKKKYWNGYLQLSPELGPQDFTANTRSRTCRPGPRNGSKSDPKMVPSERPKSSKTLCFHCFFEPLASQDGTHFGAILGSILGPHRQAAASRFRPKWPKILAKGLIGLKSPMLSFQVNYFFSGQILFFRLT